MTARKPEPPEIPAEVAAAYEAFIAGWLFGAARKVFEGDGSPFRPGVVIRTIDPELAASTRGFEIVLPNAATLRVLVFNQGKTL